MVWEFTPFYMKLLILEGDIAGLIGGGLGVGKVRFLYFFDLTYFFFFGFHIELSIFFIHVCVIMMFLLFFSFITNKLTHQGSKALS